jgi:ribose transport system ATP-binding protein
MADVEVVDVRKSFGETIALNGCSLRIRLGEVHAIVGENGSGKSTLVKILSGVLRPDSGILSIFGSAPRNPLEASRLGIATIFQEILVADEASIEENLFVGSDGMVKRRLPQQERARIATETMFRLTGQTLNPKTTVGKLPLSMKQWIVIGRAFLRQPKVLILDESSAALDLDGTARLHAEVRKLRDAGSAIVIVTHRIAELLKITDRATVLRDGQVTGELFQSEITEQNLLSLMTSRIRDVRASIPGNIQLCASDKHPILTAKDLRLQPEAPIIDFSIRPGEIVGIAGLEGQGQNNFVRVMAGLEPAVSGHPTVFDDTGRQIAIRSLHDAHRLKVDYVSGDRKKEGIFPNLSVFENLAIGVFRRHLTLGGFIKTTEIAKVYEREAARFSIKVRDRATAITSLSGGNQQKILISRALAREPRLLILNDPARGVDLGTKRDLYEELRRYAANGGAAIYLSSEIEELIGFANKVAVFRNYAIFRLLSADRVSEHAMLAAMFGQQEDKDLDFDFQVSAR